MVQILVLASATRVVRTTQQLLTFVSKSRKIIAYKIMKCTVSINYLKITLLHTRSISILPIPQISIFLDLLTSPSNLFTTDGTTCSSSNLTDQPILHRPCNQTKTNPN